MSFLCLGDEYLKADTLGHRWSKGKGFGRLRGVRWLAGSASEKIGGRLRRERGGAGKVKTFETQRREGAKKIKSDGTTENTEHTEHMEIPMIS